MSSAYGGKFGFLSTINCGVPAKHDFMVDDWETSKDLDIYNEDFRDDLIDNDEISALEQGFMEGYEKSNEGD